MCLKILLSILCLFLTLGFCIGSEPQCGGSQFSTKYFTPNGTYDSNRRLILSNLGSEVSSRGGYYNVSFGEGAGSIYALGLCIPGVEPKRCSHCIQLIADNLLRTCANQTNSYEWGSGKTLCLVSYSDISIFDSLIQGPMLTHCSPENIGNVTEFNRVWVGFMDDMIVAASSSHYAAKVSPPIGFQHIYALMQCIPGLSSLNCGVCLGRSVSKYKEICNGGQGFEIRRPVCFFRWETFPRYDAFPEPMSPSPQGPPHMSSPGDPLYATKKSGKHFPIWEIVLISLAVLVIVLGVSVYCKKMMKKKKSQSYKPMKLESKFGANPESSSSDAKTNADLHDRTFTNSPMDGKVKPPNIQVFVNFRGDELRNNFVSHLVEALRRSEINVFIDNQEQRGEDLNTLFKRIEDSGIAIVVFSSKYSESEWCLNELVKIQERVQHGLLKVLPIFYKVTTDSVKRLKGDFGDKFRDQEHKYALSDESKIKRWKEAIDFVSHKFALTFDGKSALESNFIENIVNEVMKVLQAIPTVESGQSSR